MSRNAKLQTRLQYRSGSLGSAVDAMAAEGLGLVEGAEVELRVEDGRLIIEPLRPKILEPVSDVAARQEHRRKVSEATAHAMKKHHDLLVLLAK